MDYFTLNNGMKVPAIGFGCYNPEGDVFQPIVEMAIQNGYRFFDTASLYGTEPEVGRALAASGLKRDEYMVESKAWLDEMGFKNILQANERSLNRLQMDYLDIYLIHWPRQTEVHTCVPGHPNVAMNVLPYGGDEKWKELLLETYAAMEELCDKGRIKAIGLSNFMPHHIMPILENCRIKPVVNQLELHIGYMQETAVKYSRDQGIFCEAWSPFGRGRLLNDGFLQKMASKYGVSIPQLALRFLYQSNIMVLPKGQYDSYQKQNLDFFSFEINQEDYYLLACMVPAFWTEEHPDFRLPAYETEK